MIKEQTLENTVGHIIINVKGASIHLYADNISQTLVRTNGNFVITQNAGASRIVEAKPEVQFMGSSRSNSISLSNCVIKNSIIGGNGNITVQNDGEHNRVELIVPKRINGLSFDISSVTGSMEAADLFFSSLDVQTNTGDIALEDVDMLFGNLQTNAGDISLSLVESMLNYKTQLSSVVGRIKQETIETNAPAMLETKHFLHASSVSGDVAVLYKGKR